MDLPTCFWFKKSKKLWRICTNILNFSFLESLKSFGDKTVDLFAHKKEDVTDETDQTVLIAESADNSRKSIVGPEIKADEMATEKGNLIYNVFIDILVKAKQLLSFFSN